MYSILQFHADGTVGTVKLDNRDDKILLGTSCTWCTPFSSQFGNRAFARAGTLAQELLRLQVNERHPHDNMDDKSRWTMTETQKQLPSCTWQKGVSQEDFCIHLQNHPHSFSLDDLSLLFFLLWQLFPPATLLEADIFLRNSISSQLPCTETKIWRGASGEGGSKVWHIQAIVKWHTHHS